VFLYICLLFLKKEMNMSLQISDNKNFESTLTAINSGSLGCVKEAAAKLKESYPNHSFLAKIIKVIYLLNWNTVNKLIAEYSFSYLEVSPTPQEAVVRLLWNSHLGEQKKEEGNVLLYEILLHSHQLSLATKFATWMIQNPTRSGLSSPSVNFLQAEVYLSDSPKDTIRALDSYSRVIDDPDSSLRLKASAQFGKGRILSAADSGVPCNLAEALSLYNQVISVPCSFIPLKGWAKYNKAVILKEGKDDVLPNRAEALNLFNEIIDDPDSIPLVIVQAQYMKAVIFKERGEGVQVNSIEILNYYDHLINNPNFFSKSIIKYFKAELLRMGGDGVPVNSPEALDLLNQVIADFYSGPSIAAAAKFAKAILLKNGAEGVQANIPEALDLCNQVIYHPDLLSYIKDHTKYLKAELLFLVNAPTIERLKALISVKNTCLWTKFVERCGQIMGHPSFFYLTTSEERFYYMLLLEDFPFIIERLRHLGMPADGDIQTFLYFIVTSDLPDFTEFQVQVLEAISIHYPKLKEIHLLPVAREALSKICYNAAQEKARSGDAELAHWFYQQIPFGSCKYAEGLEGLYMLHSDLALKEYPSSNHHYRSIKLIKKQANKYLLHLRAKRSSPPEQKSIIATLLRQIDEVKLKSKKELALKSSHPSLITEEILMIQGESSSQASKRRKLKD